MAGIGGASMVKRSRVGSCVSENGNKRIESGEAEEEEEEDRISVLPDFLIHHILSILPAPDLVKTSVLSKSWKYQWTRVPVLKFVPNDGMSSDNFSNFIDKTLILHDCCNIEKFVIKLKCFPKVDQFPNLDSWIRFAVRKDVKQLIVNFNHDFDRYLLPQFLFNNSSLVKLKLSYCDVMSIEKVNWESVKSLRLYMCGVEDKAIENVLSGSPLLEYLELCSCDMFRVLVIASKSLKTLILDGVCAGCSVIEISCPNLERLRISGQVWFRSLKLINMPSSVHVTLYFFLKMESLEDEMSHDDCINFVQQTLRQVDYVKKLEIGHWLMEILLSSNKDGDWLGGLLDFFIHRIISFCPLTKDAFESDLYSMWKRKWTDVPILNFVANDKFVIDSKDIPLACLDPRLSFWIRFAAKKDIKELILNCDVANVELGYEYPLPQFLFNNSSLVKMKICACNFMPKRNVNWESLKSLQLGHSFLGNQALENVLSGSPLLECLELHCCDFEGAVVASEHLKTFILVELCNNCHFLEISCPNLESLKIYRYLGSPSLKLMNLPSSLHASLEFYILESDDISFDDCVKKIDESVKQIPHVEEVEIELRRLRS